MIIIRGTIKSSSYPLLLILLGLLYLPNSFFAQNSEESIIPLKLNLKQAETVEERVDIINEICMLYSEFLPDSMLVYAKSAVNLAKQSNYRRGLAGGYRNLGEAYYKTSAPADTAVYYIKEGVKLAEETGAHYIACRAYINLGMSHISTQETNQAIFYFSKSLYIIKKYNFEKRDVIKTATISAMGVAYLYGKEYEKAKAYLEQAAEIARSDNDEERLSTLLDDLGEVYFRLGKTSKGEKVLKECVSLQEKTNSVEGKLQTQILIAKLRREAGNIAAAKTQVQNLLALKNEYKNSIYETHIYVEAARLAYVEGDRQAALQYSDSLLVLINSNPLTVLTPDVKDFLEQLYSESGDFDIAYQLLNRRYKTLKNSIDSTQRRIGDEVEARLQVEQSKKDRLALKNYNRLLIWASLSLLTAFIASIFLWFFARKSKKRLQQSNKELNEAYSKLENANKQTIDAYSVKENFLSVMSHEIRTPLSAISGFIDILKYESPRKDQSEYLQHLGNASSHLHRIIDDILDYSKISANKISLESIPFDLKATLDSLMITFNVINKNDALTIKLLCKDDIPEQIIGDQVRLNQILFNLLSNAVKFTKEGYIELLVKVINRTEKDIELYFSVEDTGIGISQEQQKIIFEYFQQASSATTREFGGTGLGLAIVKELVELQGSEINLKSKVGEGSHFSFKMSFPMAKASPINTILNEQHPKERDLTVLSGKKILLAEDNLFNQKIVSKCLDRWDVQYKIVGNGLDAFEAVKKDDFDLILMDISMPKLNGIEATKHIRSLEHSKKDVPIIALTANAFGQSIEQAKQAGMNDFITKPFKREIMYDLLASILEQEMVEK